MRRRHAGAMMILALLSIAASASRAESSSSSTADDVWSSSSTAATSDSSSSAEPVYSSSSSATAAVNASSSSSSSFSSSSASSASSSSSSASSALSSSSASSSASTSSSSSSAHSSSSSPSSSSSSSIASDETSSSSSSAQTVTASSSTAISTPITFSSSSSTGSGIDPYGPLPVYLTLVEVVRVVLAATLTDLLASFGSVNGITAQLRLELRTLFGIGSARIQSPVIAAYFAESTLSHASTLRLRHARKVTEQAVLTFDLVPPVAGSTASTDPAYASSATQLALALRTAAADSSSGLYTQALLGRSSSIATTGVAMFTCADNVLRADCNPSLSSSGASGNSTSSAWEDDDDSNGFRDLAWWVLLLIFAAPVVLLCLIFILVRCCCTRRSERVAPKTVAQQSQVDNAQHVIRYVNKPTDLEMELYHQSVGLDAQGKPIPVPKQQPPQQQIPSPSQQRQRQQPRPLERLAQIEEADYQERQLSARSMQREQQSDDRFSPATPTLRPSAREESLMSPEEKTAVYEERILQAQRAQVALQREEDERLLLRQQSSGAPLRRSNLNLPPLRIQASSPGNLSPMRTADVERSQGVTFEQDANERQRSMPPAWHTPVRAKA